MRLIALMSVLFLVACGEKKTGFSVDNIPDPRQQGVYVSNPDHIINETTVASLNGLMEGLDKEGTAYVAIVVLKTIGDKVPKEVANEIFKLWKPGDAAKNNGLLVLLVEDQHRIEFETGYGLEGDLPDVICFRIQQQKMVPLFKQNDYDAGMIQGMDAVAAVLRHAQVAETEYESSTDFSEPIYQAHSRKLPDDWMILPYVFSIFPSTIIAGLFIRKKAKNGRPFNTSLRLFTPGFFSGLWVYVFPAIAVLAYLRLTDYNFYWWTLLGIFYLNWLTYLLYRITVININAGRLLSDDRKQRYDALNLAHKNFGAYAFIFPIPLYFYHKWNQRRMTHIRNTPFSCEECNTSMELVSKRQLDKGQQAEENIRSVSYDVWDCPTCSEKKVVGYESIRTSATECPSCHYKTLQTSEKVVIQRPTYNAQGSGLQYYKCAHCDYIEKTPYVIAKLTSSSRSSSGSFSSSSSSSGSGSSSGGRSGGGGAGSSW